MDQTGHMDSKPPWLKRFGTCEHGGIAVIFSLVLLPVMALIGMTIDYSHTAWVRDRLNAATDAAAIAAVGVSSNPSLLDPSKAKIKSILDAAAAAMPGVTLTKVKLTSTRIDRTLSVTVSYKADVATYFTKILGVETMTVAGDASSSRAIPPYVDFYLLLDNSPSMGLGATTADINTMISITSDSCAFACHQHTFDSQGNVTGDNTSDYYHKARANNVTLRIDVLRTATQRMAASATASTTVPSQFRMGVYTFSDTMQTISSLSSDMTAVSTAAGAIDLAYAYYDQRDTQTSYDTVLPAINSAMTSPGDGLSAGAPQKFLFLVTDGVQDEPINNLPSPKPVGNVGSNRRISVIDTGLCTAIKNRGIKIAALYTTYLPVTNNGFYNSWVAPISSSLPISLQACASPGFYFEVSPTGGIDEAMQAMFQQAITTARLTQ